MLQTRAGGHRLQCRRRDQASADNTKALIDERRRQVDDSASDVAYCNIRAAANEHTQSARAECEALWETYEAYADPEFLVEIRSGFDARYWEM